LTGTDGPTPPREATAAPRTSERGRRASSDPAGVVDEPSNLDVIVEQVVRLRTVAMHTNARSVRIPSLD
jgi:hypothetical protein